MEQREKELKLGTVRLKALQLGFSGFGVAGTNLNLYARKFRQWLGMTYHGEMEYMQRREKERLDLEEVLPGVKSVICLSHNYLTTEKDMTFLENGKEGDISLYALGQDYHDVIKPRLRDLEGEIKKQFPGCKTKSYVDTGPILEKPLAQNAGLGWIGKHTNLITEAEGSWYFLSEILTTTELPKSFPAIDRCGSCRSCIDICPTGAIVAPYVLDSRRCISYLTIELKGVIPLKFRKAIGNRIYGCDDCQIVCPWNSSTKKTDESAYKERQGTRRLIELMGIDDGQFQQQFNESPIWRLKRKRFLRNVAIALGNSGDLEAVPVLTASLEDSEPLIRAHVVWALGQLLEKQAVLIFEERLRDESEEIVLIEIKGVKEFVNSLVN
tara:strand:+ start:934 stop:2079 length:1146 start_codon:yes stop_codon:yes gene_type:complete